MDERGEVCIKKLWIVGGSRVELERIFLGGPALDEAVMIAMNVKYGGRMVCKYARNS